MDGCLLNNGILFHIMGYINKYSNCINYENMKRNQEMVHYLSTYL